MFEFLAYLTDLTGDDAQFIALTLYMLFVGAGLLSAFADKDWGETLLMGHLMIAFAWFVLDLWYGAPTKWWAGAAFAAIGGVQWFVEWLEERSRQQRT